jgi:hypothetical protein
MRKIINPEWVEAIGARMIDATPLGLGTMFGRLTQGSRVAATLG